nr:PREDICTED: G-protein coupled receptor 35 [Equus przewalskii]
MNNSNCSTNELTWPPAVMSIFYTYTGVVLVLGLLLNSLALWVLCCRMQQWTETRVYMANLAVADLCLLCTLPFVLYSLKHSTTKDTPFCQLSQGIYLANRYMSISLIMAIAVDRYLAVRHPMRVRGLRSPRQAMAVCLALWVLVVGSLVLRWILGSFYPPLVVLVFCSLQVVTALGRRPTADLGQVEASRKAARMVWANLVVFVVCFLPLHVMLTVFMATSLPTCVIRRALYITSRLSDGNCCLDAICYYYMAKEFQEASALPGLPTAKVHKSQESLCVTLA